MSQWFKAFAMSFTVFSKLEDIVDIGGACGLRVSCALNVSL
jgi:hypothetical protein